MQQEVIYTWCWSEIDKRQISITKKIFEGERCVFTCTLDPVIHHSWDCRHQGALAQLFNETMEKFNG